MDPSLTLIKDNADPGNPFQVVQGIPDQAGKFKRKSGYMMDTSYYGRAVFEKTNVYGNDTKEIVPHVQRCIPLGDEAVGTDAPSMGTRMFLVKEGVGGGPRAGTVGSTTNTANPHGLDPFWSVLDSSTSSSRFNVKSGITVMLRFRLSAETDVTNKNIVALANPDTGTASWSIYRASTNSVGMMFNGQGGGTSVSTSITVPHGKWAFGMFYFSRWGSNKSRVMGKIFDSITGAQIGASSATGGVPSTSTAPPQNMNLYIGVGESSGGVNPEFKLSDFGDGVEIADIMIVRGVPHPTSAGQPYNENDWPPYIMSSNGLAMSAFFMATQHLPYNNYKSGINNAPARRVRNILDARQTYPPSNHGIAPSSNLTPFNDHLNMPVFGDPTLYARPLVSGSNFNSKNRHSSLPGGTIAQSNYMTGADGTITQIENPHNAHLQTMMFPEMMPAMMFSGSGRFEADGEYKRSTWGTSQSDRIANATEKRSRFWRDANRTPFEYRIKAPGMVRPGVTHEPTFLLNEWNYHNNTFSQNTVILGGAIAPFDDSAVPTNSSVINKPAVDPAVFEGLDQPLGDHIAIVIDMNPVEDTTIGIDPNEHIELVGSARVEAKKNTSIAYYNFTTQKWETYGASGKHWIVPGVSASNAPVGQHSLGSGGFHGSVWWDSTAPDFVSGSHGGRGKIYGAPGQNTITYKGLPGQSGAATRISPLTQLGSPTSGSYIWTWAPSCMWGKINTNPVRLGNAPNGVQFRNNLILPIASPAADGIRILGIDDRLSNGAPNGANNFSLAPYQIGGVQQSVGIVTRSLSDTTDYSHSFAGLLASASIAFAGTSGFTIYPDRPGQALADLKNRARPTSLCGFPYDDRWEASAGQELDISKYIDQPFLLEKFAVHFDAEIEDSGPQSLGYKLHDDRIISPCAIFDDHTEYSAKFVNNRKAGAVSKQGGTVVRLDIDSDMVGFRINDYVSGEAASQAKHRLDAGRGHLLGGNWMHRFDRRKTAAAASIYQDYPGAGRGQPICTVTGSMQGIFGVGPQSAALNTFHTSLNTGTGGSDSVSSRWRTSATANGGLPFSSSFKLGNPISQAGTSRDVYMTYGPVGTAGAYQATPGMFLPVAAPMNKQTGLPAYDNFNAVWGTEWPGGFIPILPAGAAGLVTGSQYALKTSLPGHAPSRWGVVQMPLPTHGDFDGNHNYGAPFWRCDTFFLLRQEKNSAPTATTRNPVQWTGQMKQMMWENRNYMRRLSSWQDNTYRDHYEGEWFPVVGDPGIIYAPVGVSSPTGNQVGAPRRNARCVLSFDERWDFPSQMRLYQQGLTMPRKGNQGSSTNLASDRDGILARLNKFPHTETTVSSKTRELISYAQMTHYGYCTAPDSVIISSSNGDNKKLAFTQGVKYSNTGSANSLPIWVSDMGDYNFNGDYALAWGAMFGQLCAGSNFPAPVEETSGANKGMPASPAIASPVLPRKSLMAFDHYGQAATGSQHTYSFYDRIEVWPGKSVVNSPVMPSNAGTHPDWDLYGNFEKAGSVTGSVPVYSHGNPKVNDGWGIGEFKFTGPDHFAKYTSWIDAGLGRDLNIKITPGMTHTRARSQTANAYVTSSLCSFSILTASTVHRALHRTGSWSGDLPVVCNLYERRLLNAGHFQVEAPIRTQPPAVQSAIHDWALTIPNGTPMFMGFEFANIDIHRSNTLGTADGVNAAGYRSGDWNGELGSSQWNRSMISKPLVDSWMVRTGSFMPVHAAPPTLARLFGSLKAVNVRTHEGSQQDLSSVLKNDQRPNGSGFQAINESALVSGRRFVKGITAAAKPTPVHLPQSWPGMNWLASPFTAFTGQSVVPAHGGKSAACATNFSALQRLPQLDGMQDDAAQGLATTSSIDQRPQDSLYVLMPGDKLVLGFQPALYGGNPGSGMISNPNLSKWGPYDYESSSATGNVKGMTTGSINMEMQYEPARAFTLKSMKSGGKLILYGTLLRNNKHAPGSLNQNLTNNYVHQAIGNDTVTDQFLISSRNTLQGTYLDMYNAGSILNKYEDAVASFITSSNPGAVAAGKAAAAGAEPGFNRDSFWSTSNRLRALGVRFSRSLFVSQSAFQPSSTYSNLHISGSVQRFVTLVDRDEVYYDSLGLDIAAIWQADGLPGAGGTGYEGTYVLTPNDTYNPTSAGAFSTYFNAHWPRAFPFENRYKNVSRLANRNARLGLSLLIRTGSGTTTAAADTLEVIQLRLNDEYDAVFGADYVGKVENANNDAYKDSAAALFGFTKIASTTMILTASANNIPSSDWQGATNRVGRNPIPTLHPRTFPAAGGGYVTNDNQWHHPHGVKYGMINYDHQPTAARYRPDHYGHLRDCFEQRRYTKFLRKASEGSPQQVTEAAVSCIFVDGDGNPLEDGVQTSCMNISHFMTSSVPYKEGETPSRNPIVNEQLVTISSLVGTRFQ